MRWSNNNVAKRYMAIFQVYVCQVPVSVINYGSDRWKEKNRKKAEKSKENVAMGLELTTT